MRKLVFFESICDSTLTSVQQPVADGHLEFKCDLCDAVLMSKKGLAQHRRVKHGARIEIRRFISDSGECPGCHTFSVSPPGDQTPE